MDELRLCSRSLRILAGVLWNGLVPVVRGRLQELEGVDCFVWPGNGHALPASGLDGVFAELYGARPPLSAAPGPADAP
ncbi:unnamed protein product [Prorocentrum cordatum]|uniref:Uncharacterized protein n=1 Tax=Prorocentrum cordatum TaxID=2364126 RepID=A0ABN9T1T4_9DINO|nr:unnamed protein product [Polarella glacialis]